MRVAILGCGAAGSAIARLLAKDRHIDGGIALDMDVRKAKKFLGKETGFEIKRVDAKRKEKLFKLVRGTDLLINALPTSFTWRGKFFFFNLKIMEIALRAGIDYIDLACEGDDRRFMAEQLIYHKKFERERLLALINAGAAPGLTNLLARYNADELDSVERIRIRTLEEQRGSEFILPWSKKSMLDIVYKSLVYRNKKFRFKEPFSEVDIYEFPSPFGKMPCYLVSHDEVYTIPHYIPIRHLDMKAGGSDLEMLRTFYRLGLFEKEEIAIKGVRIPPMEFLSTIIPDIPTPAELLKIFRRGWLEDGFFGIFVESIGRAVRKRIFIKSYILFPDQKAINKKLPGTNYISYPTAIAAVSFIEAAFRRRIYGAFPPEALPPVIRKRVMAGLERRGIVVNVEYRSL